MVDAATDRRTDLDPPDPCTFDPAEWRVLAGFWHPVAYAHDVGPAPVGVTLLDEDLVVYRTSQGVVAAKNICLHRGSQLTLGSIDGDELVCRYHGWRYGPEGRCTRIPSQPPERKIAPSVRLLTVGCVERYGVIWVCLSPTPTRPMYEWPECEDPSYRWLSLEPQEWNTSAARQIENFLDVSHFGFVHTGTFGNPDVTLVADVDVQVTEYGLHYEYPYLASNPEISRLGDSPTIQRWMVYDAFLPFTARLRIQYPEKGEGAENVIYNAAQPVSEKRMRVFMFFARSFDHDVPAEEVVDFDRRVVAEDRPVVESQRPERLPLDLTAELHVQADKATIAYRRGLAGLGLGATYSR
jgi:vanillate O-demethylase monooxygenase subunit